MKIKKCVKGMTLLLCASSYVVFIGSIKSQAMMGKGPGRPGANINAGAISGAGRLGVNTNTNLGGTQGTGGGYVPKFVVAQRNLTVSSKYGMVHEPDPKPMLGEAKVIPPSDKPKIYPNLARARQVLAIGPQIGSGHYAECESKLNPHTAKIIYPKK